MRIGLALLLIFFCHGAAEAADWREAKWPFPRDAWPAGQALSCVHAACSGKELVIARVKFGFCNCEDGVRDDAEVDYVSDMDLISPNFVPVSVGEPLNMFGLRGRLRLYAYPVGDRRHLAVGLALSRKCDVVAMSVMNIGSEKEAEKIVRLMMQSGELRNYVALTLGERIPQ